MNDGAQFIVIILFVIIVVCFFLASHFIKMKRIIEDIPTSKAKGVFIGLVELKGTAESDSDSIINSKITNTPSIYYSMRVLEEWGRWETSINTDSRGHITTEREWETGWTLLTSEENLMPAFYLQDETGVVQIVPEGASLEVKTYLDQTCRRNDPLYYSLGFPTGIPNTTGRRHFMETGIALHEPIYVIGRSRVREDIVAAEITADKESPIFKISVMKEEGQVLQYNSIVMVLIAIACVCTFILGLANNNSKLEGLAAVLLFLGVWFIRQGWHRYYSLVAMKNRVKQARANLVVELKRRHDLIPQLVAVTQAMMRHELVMNDIIAVLRTQLPNSGRRDYPKAVSPYIRSVVERYPNLRSNELFLNLQKNLRDTEDRIALARNYFNEMVEYNNNYLMTIPDCFFACLAGCRYQKSYEADGFERVIVPVTFKK